ncbi:MAG: hypothetical protein Hyperionvirus1_116 [Hyperionvirus sp.]|uniref:Uncharacterized protein n=1 Tax=Hyperionvirus sp. TaxID=2487770 RepID=A0A3G5A5M9_9VIRU|nr:MAG: hypothetical protein Hyperionvirus1_116 [Hyperionvirus sp.]
MGYVIVVTGVIRRGLMESAIIVRMRKEIRGSRALSVGTGFIRRKHMSVNIVGGSTKRLNTFIHVENAVCHWKKVLGRFNPIW